MNSIRIMLIPVLLLLLVSSAAAGEELEQPVLTEEEFDLEFEILSAAAAGQDTIVFPRATYLRESTIILSNISDIYIIFEPGSKILLDDTERHVIQLQDCNNIHISGGYFSHVEPEEFDYCQGSVFDLVISNSITIDHCEVRGCGKVGFFVTECSDLFITDCVIKDNTQTAFLIVSVDELLIADCVIADNDRLFTFLDNGAITRLRMVGNTITNNGFTSN
ncbi:MAG: right-handed parallel beta-helix repeat-containing protein [Candidatus Sabulitectum sp.]|nr:right-handed parallel beta-helix repeat-containing protein [Candidatus Sabulitectum sp.]